VPTRVDAYSIDGADVPVNELTFEFRDGFVQVGYQGFIEAGTVPLTDELQFVGTATSVGTSLQFDLDACDSCSVFDGSGISCNVPDTLPYSATASSLVTIQRASNGSTVVITYSRQ
jgi:hypothetical protein